MFSTDRASGSSGTSLVFFVVWTTTGRYTLLTLFMAVLMDSFEVATERSAAEREDELDSDTAGALQLWCRVCCACAACLAP